MKKLIFFVVSIFSLASVFGSTSGLTGAVAAKNISESSSIFIAGPGYSLSFTVDDGLNPIAGAYVTCNDTVIQTDANGTAIFLLPVRITPFSYLINAPGYVDYSGDILVSFSTSLAVHMSTFHTIRFSVNNGVNPLEGAIIQINGDTAITGASGIATFSTKYPGNSTYFYSIIASGYADSSGQFYLSDSDIQVGPISLESAYDITFTVRNEADSLISAATVKLNDESILTDSSGVAVFYKKINGTYNWQVSANGYVDKTGQVVISNSGIPVNVVLSTGYKLTLTILNGPIGTVPLAWDTVSIGNISNITNDTSGIVVFGLSPGSYPINLHKTGFADTTIIVNIVDSDTSVSAHLTPIYKVIFKVADGISFSMKDSVAISFNGLTKFTDSLGTVEFTNVSPAGSDKVYFANITGYIADTGYISVPYNSVTVDIQNTIAESVYIFEPGIGISLTANNGSYTGAAVIKVDSESYSYDSIAGVSYIRVIAGYHTYKVIPDDINKAVITGNFTYSGNKLEFVDVLISTAFTISFNTMDSLGYPISDAKVTFNGDTALTDTSGIVRYYRIPPGSVYYSIVKPNFDTIPQTFLNVDTSSLEVIVIMNRNSFSVTVIVSDNSGYVADVQLTMFGPYKQKGESNPDFNNNPGGQNAFGGITKYTGIDGRAVFNNIKPGDYSYNAIKGGYRDSTMLVKVVNTDVISHLFLGLAGLKNNYSNEMRPYPNPTANFVYLNIPENISQAAISVISMNGLVLRNFVQTREEGAIVKIDLQDYPSGQYFIELRGKDQKKIWKVTKK